VAAHLQWKRPAISLAHQPATLRQRRFVLSVAVLQFVACLVISSFPASVPRIDGFIPAILAIVFIADLITAILLFNQSSLIASRALLVLANGYLFSALIVIPHALRLRLKVFSVRARRVADGSMSSGISASSPPWRATPG
jgi:hypothetical protein